ncbi:MAG: peptidoglycan DD-metalloendopeptidase family protein [Bacteroidales bacterium]|nr:peptidoglycan DD-metalloendopeptidase family protein [Bacteroidales bacterium]
MKNKITTAILSLSSLLCSAQTDLSAEADSAEVVAIDTVRTNDRYTRIILYSNHTWEYWDLGRPQINEEDFKDHWSSDVTHAYNDVPLADLPDEIDLLLADSIHNYCAPITGIVRSRFAFRKKREHKGTDIPLTIGDPVKAAFDGKVRVVKSPKQSGGYGNLVVIRHSNGLETYYGHLQKHNVEVDDIVKAGDVIGYGGNTGRSTGPHLHFEVRYQSHPFDPERIINFETGELRDSIFILKKHYFNIYSHYGQTDEESIDASKRKIHTVRSGDTLGGIAAKYGTTVNNICKLNGITSKKTLRIGQRLIVR